MDKIALLPLIRDLSIQSLLPICLWGADKRIALIVGARRAD